MIIFPDVIVEKLIKVPNGALIYLPIAKTIVPAIKGLGKEEGDDVHAVFILKPIPGSTKFPTMRIPNETQHVLNFGEDWIIELPLDPAGLNFDELSDDDTSCGVVVVGQKHFLRVYCHVTTRERAVFLDLSSGAITFQLPEGTEVFFPGWTISLPDSRGVITSWPHGAG